MRMFWVLLGTLCCAGCGERRATTHASATNPRVSEATQPAASRASASEAFVPLPPPLDTTWLVDSTRRQYRIAYDQPISARYRLVVTRDTIAGVYLVGRDDSHDVRPVGRLDVDADGLAVADVDSTGGTICALDSYGFERACIKAFFPTIDRPEAAAVPLAFSANVDFGSDSAAMRVLGVSASELVTLRGASMFAPPAPEPEETRAARWPQVFRQHPLPQSTYEAFAEARPDRVRDGYDREATQIVESVGAWEQEGDRTWLGVAFYDGEGLTGVGRVGYVTTSGEYTFLRLPAVAPWSVDAMLVEPNTVWIALVMHPEGAARSGGLLAYSRHARRTMHYDIPDVIQIIRRVGDAVFVASGRGLYVIRGSSITRYRMEPNERGVVSLHARPMRRPAERR